MIPGGRFRPLAGGTGKDEGPVQNGIEAPEFLPPVQAVIERKPPGQETARVMPVMEIFGTGVTQKSS
jgi:hypothetical protein